MSIVNGLPINKVGSQPRSSRFIDRLGVACYTQAQFLEISHVIVRIGCFFQGCRIEAAGAQ